MKWLPRWLVEWWEWRRLPRLGGGKSRSKFTDMILIDRHGRPVGRITRYNEERRL